VLARQVQTDRKRILSSKKPATASLASKRRKNQGDDEDYLSFGKMKSGETSRAATAAGGRSNFSLYRAI